jgi:predicted PurR-regulated permease PerM
VISVLKVSRKDLLFIFSFLIAFLFFKGLGGSLWPFVVGLIGAYLALPTVQRLEKMGVPRVVGTLFFLVIFLSVVVVSLWFLLPYLWSQLIQLTDDIPRLLSTVLGKTGPWLRRMGINVDNLGSSLQIFLKSTGQGVHETLVKRITWLIGAGIGNIFGFVLLWLQLLMAPVFFFFILGDFERIKHTIIEWIPSEVRPDFLDFFYRSNHILGSFFRGQFLLAVTLGCYYSLALGILGLPYGFLIGFVSGILSFIPYVGFSVGLVTSISVGIGNGSWMLAIGAASVYLGGQALDNLFLTPRLVGKAVGLSPLAAILSAIVGANLLGLPGVLLGIPLVACTRELWLILKE